MAAFPNRKESLPKGTRPAGTNIFQIGYGHATPAEGNHDPLTHAQPLVGMAAIDSLNLSDTDPGIVQGLSKGLYTHLFDRGFGTFPESGHPYT
jgi:hypothetical protein